MIKRLPLLLLLGCIHPMAALQAGGDGLPEKYNVVWDSPSKDYNGSMPIGNGDIGANVWVEPTGDLIFYLSKTDAWSGGGPDPELLKLGRFRVRLDKPLFQEGAAFRQELDLKTGSITINASVGENKRSIRFWIDANHPVVHLDIQSSTPCTAEIALESWRAEGKYLRGGAQKDIILPADGQAVRWYQRNVHSIFRDNMKNQHMGDVVDQFPDPLIHRTFGGVISGKGLKSKDDKTLATAAPMERIEIQIHPLTAQTKTADEWLLQLEEQRKTGNATPIGEAWSAHVKWWQSFWQRSWIDVTQSAEPVKKEIPSLIPSNDLNFRIGVTKGNHEKFPGEVGRVSILNRALSEPEIQSLADNKTQTNGLKAEDILFSSAEQLYSEIDDSADWTDRPAITMEAWVKPSDTSVPGRILDKTIPGNDAGFLLDTFPGNGLRLIAGDKRFMISNCLKSGEWSHVAVAVDADQDRMEIYLNGARVAGEKSATVKSDSNEAFAVSQAYTLQRWVQACAGRGAYPIKFNGSLFTVDAVDAFWKFPEGQYAGPDYMRWGGPYWFQNTRLIYWPMLASGDYEQMAPLFALYRNMLPLLKERARRYFGHGGVHFSETTEIWGLNRDVCFGKDNPGFYPTSTYMKYNWDCGLELSTMLLAYYQHTQDQAFVGETLLPIADQVVTFYEQHYQRDKDGKLHIYPSQALETWQNTENPTTVLAGMRVVLAGLLALPESLTTSEQRKRWTRVLGEIREVPIAEEAGKKWIKPAHVFSDKKNAEHPELYAVFPYPIYGVGKPDLEIGLETYKRRENKRTGGWQQDAIQAALLGQTADAKSFLLQNVTTENLMGGATEKAKRPDSRFPAFWGPNFDWIPDQCNGSVILSTLQYMLMQTDGKKIILLPAWPKEWKASFKLHAPYQTTVEGRVENGKVVDLKVTPESRIKDIVNAEKLKTQ